jgi:SOS-response transcriptional repressor LexA
MHKVQEQLLALADTEDLGSSSYYSLAKRLGVANHGSIKFHFDQLLNKGLLVKNSKSGSISKVTEGEQFTGFINIPIMGEANCGEPTSFADDRVQSFLPVSPSILPAKVKLDKLYGLVAVGNSMNKASIGGKSIHSGDYVLAETIDRPNNGDYVVSIFDDVANIKRFFVDPQHSRILLVSESDEYRSPIIIAEEDFPSYHVSARVVGVIPAVRQMISETQS